MDLLAHLEAYVATVDEASFSRAADRLGIAQPLLSRRIKTLEEHFGGLLFDRSHRQVATTEFGVLLLPYAQDVLERAERLRRAARSARRSAVRTVGMPVDCGPAALARVIRAGAEHGVALGVQELPPERREAGLADGSLAYALVRVPPENAPLRVPLGLGSTPAPDAPSTPDAPHPPHAPAGSGARDGGGPGGPPASRAAGAVHLEDLRPRRGRGTAHGRAPLALLLLAEDQVPFAADRLGRAMARAGLPEGLLRPAGPVATALAETLAGRVRLLCTEPFARLHGLTWAPLHDTSLHRGYAPRASERQPAAAQVPHWLATVLASGAGAAAPGAAAARSAAGDGDGGGSGDGDRDADAPARLAAHG
ncbi:LysR family transcriptional regulator [Streptomyces sp. NPDC003703]|uniref:LysR family transcriptional regulator n=1 Tax=Streptomyces sp. NPDC003283 TaxID=3364681 RepID=UPI00368D6BD6